MSFLVLLKLFFLVSAGGYRSLGLGSRGGLKQGGYGAQGAYGKFTSSASSLIIYYLLLFVPFYVLCLQGPVWAQEWDWGQD